MATTHQLREDLLKVLDVDLVAVLGFSLFLGPHGRFWRHQTRRGRQLPHHHLHLLLANAADALASYLGRIFGASPP